MSASSGPSIQTSGLTFLMDVANPACINASSCVGYNNATQLIKNLVNPLSVTSSSSTLRLGNLNYFTAFAIDYPESTFGGAAASRQGLTPDFNVTSGAKTYDASRALHLWVWNNDTASWVADSFFTGERLSGHCYDSYVGTAEVDKWVVDFNKIKNTFNNITVIAMGSHRDSYHTTAQYEILRDLGAPANVDSIIGFSSPEWILVGKPRLGAGNGAWSFQNYSTNPDQVAHMNFGIPFKGNTSNYLNFNGSSDFITNSSFTGHQTTAGTITGWAYPTSTSGDLYFVAAGGTTTYGASRAIRINSGSWCSVNYGSATEDWNGIVNANLNTWQHVAYVWSGTTIRFYLNGVEYTNTRSGMVTPLGSVLTIGATSWSPVYGYWPGRIGTVQAYNRALSATEVQQNFNAQRTRYGI